VTVTLATPGAQQNTVNAGLDTLTSIENLVGSGFNDALTGDAGANVLEGGLGDDTLNGSAGADTLVGGDGSDRYFVDSLGDVVSESNALAAGGSDLVTSEIDYTLGANVENLQLDGQPRSPASATASTTGITGSAGHNTLQGGLGDDTLDGGAGTDTASYAGATAGVTVTLTTPGVATEHGQCRPRHPDQYREPHRQCFQRRPDRRRGANLLEGGLGDDTLNGGLGNDTLDGGSGTDTASYAGATAGVTVTLATPGVQQNTVTAGLDTLTDIENLTGSAFNDRLTGNAGNNRLEGGLGNDILNGGAGVDALVGGDGSDTYYVDNPGDVVSETNAAAAGGTDLVNSQIDYTLGANVENLQLAGSAISGTGNSLNNRITGSAGNNILQGGLGNDTLDGGASTDTATYAAATAGVTVTLATPGVQQNTISAGLDTLTSIENLTGSNFNDTLTGGTGNNALQGGSGNDTLDGGAGSDTVDGGSGDDRGVYRPSAASVGDTDTYKGSLGNDTLSLELTHAELNNAQVQADLHAYEEFLRLNANAAVATGAEFQFAAFALKASAWEHLEVTDTDGMIWRNGTAGVTIGTAAARTTLQIGTNAAASTGDIWTGAVPSGSDNWSVDDNWADTSAPTPADTVVFNATDPGGRSVVDPAFQGTIAGLVDTGEASHTVEFQRALKVSGPVAVHTDNDQNTGSLTICNTPITLHLSDLNVGINATGSGTANGYLLLNSGALIDATDVGGVSVGAAVGGSAYGAIRLASNSTFNVGTVVAPADINIGWTYGDDGAAASVGVLDALNSAASVNWNLDELLIGRSSGYGTAKGTLRWNQTEAILANGVYFAYGGGTTAVLDVPTGGRLQLGTAADPVGILDIADNFSGGAKASANLDFSLTNPTFTAYVGKELRIGASLSGAAEGTLKLASNSTLNVGTEASPADINIGWSYRNYDDAASVGVLDALNSAASVNWNLDELLIGRSSGYGTAKGTLRWNQTEAILANGVYFAYGGGTTAVLDVPTGGRLQLGTAADSVGILDIADNFSGGAKASANLDFSLTNPTFTAYVGKELRIGASLSGAAEGTLKLASNSTLNVGTEASPADINIGWSYRNYDDAASVGVLDALNSAASVNWNLDELLIGRSSGYGTAKGTLRWNQTEAILANGVYFAYGGGTTAVLDVPTGGRLQLGTAADPVGILDIADNFSGGAKASANLDFSLTNPTFTAYVGTELRIGSSFAAEAEGSLKLASNSTLNVGSAAALADINIGWSYSDNYAATAVGVLDALNPAASLNWHLNQLFVGRTSHGIGSATGTLLMGEGVSSDANAVAIGSGAGATGLFDILGGSLHATTLTLASGTLDLNDSPLWVGSTGSLNAQTLNLSGGLLTGQTVSIDGGTFNFSGGVLSVDTFNGLLDQNGGVLAPGNSVGQTSVNGDYDLASAGTVKIEIFGSTFNTTTKLYDRLAVNGTVKLNGDNDPSGGGTLDVDLGYSPSVGSKLHHPRQRRHRCGQRAVQGLARGSELQYRLRQPDRDLPDLVFGRNWQRYRADGHRQDRGGADRPDG
jgi:Ca2+-binding RTX toxin-like protein